MVIFKDVQFNTKENSRTMSVKAWLIAIIVCASLSGCNQIGANQKDLQIFRQDVIRLRTNCDKLTKQLEELTKLTADLREQVAMLREAPKPATIKPLQGPEPSMAAPAEPERIREPNTMPGLCDIVETHIAAVEGILSQPDPDSVGPLLDDLAAAFNANLRAFAQHPHIKQIQEAAAAMRSDYLAVAKQAPLATNPYLKHVRQKSLNDARRAARKLRSLCEN